MTENTQAGTAASPNTPAADPQPAPVSTPDIVKNPDVLEPPAPEQAGQPGETQTQKT